MSLYFPGLRAFGNLWRAGVKTLLARSYGSSTGEGEQCAENERQKKRFDLRFEFAGESFGDGLEEFEGGMLSLQNHGSSFWG